MHEQAVAGAESRPQSRPSRDARKNAPDHSSTIVGLGGHGAVAEPLHKTVLCKAIPFTVQTGSPLPREPVGLA